MKRKIIILMALLFVFCIIENINVSAHVEEDITGEQQIEKINVLENEINIQFDNEFGTINIENKFFKISSNFILYTLETFSMANNTVIMECEESNVSYLGLNFNSNSLDYIIVIGNIYYYSSNEFKDTLSTIDFYDTDIREFLLNLNPISNTDGMDMIQRLQQSACSAFACFNFFYDSVKTQSRISNSDYELTGDQSAINDMYFFIESGFFDISKFVTQGVHFGTVYDNEGEISYIYAIDTSLEQPWNVYASSIKLWEISYHTFMTGSNTGVTINFLPYKEFYIVGYESGGQIQIPDEGDSNFGLMNVAFDFTTSGLSYINKYNITCKNNGNYETPSALSIVDSLLVKFVDEYENVSSAFQTLDSGISYFRQISYDEATSYFYISNGEETLRSIGFELSSSDIQTSVFNQKWLHNYSFYQTMILCDVPNYDIDAFFRIKIDILTTYYDEATLSYFCDLNINNGYICNHPQNFIKLSNEIHTVSCNVCGYSFNEIHSNSYTANGKNFHLVECSKCNYSHSESHSFIVYQNGNRCKKCFYFTTGNVIVGPLQKNGDEAILNFEKKKDE